MNSCSLLDSLGDDEKVKLASDCNMAFANRGETIWLAGSKPQFVCVIGHGFIKMCRSTSQGTDVAVELLGKGQCCGLLACLEGRPYPLSAVAVTDTWYLKIPTWSFTRLYADTIGLRDLTVMSVAPRLRRAHDMMARMSSGKVEQRIAAVLAILADSYGVDTGEGIELSVPLTRQDLAEMAGTTVETSIRVMSRWQKEGLLSTDKQIITIVDPSMFERMLHG